MSNSAIITQKTGMFMQISDMSFAYITQGDRAGAHALNLLAEPSNNEINRVEDYIMYNMIKGKTANDISDNDNNFDGIWRPLNNAPEYSFGSNVLINNSAINTPNLALLTSYFPKSSDPTTITIDVGTNIYTTISGSVELDISSAPVMVEDVSFSFTSNVDDELNKSIYGNIWYVGFDNNSNISKAMNSQLSCLSGNVPAYPIEINESGFNQTDALRGDSNKPFNTFYVTPNAYGTNSYISEPTSQDYSNNEVAGYARTRTTYESDAYYNDNFSYGAWEFSQNESTIDVSYSNSVGTLPFGIALNSGTGAPMATSYTYGDFSTIFSGVDSTVDFSFIIQAVSGVGAGYYFTGASGGLTLNSSNLSNNFDYTKNKMSGTHKINIKNGTVDVSGIVGGSSVRSTVQYLNSNLSSDSEQLDSAHVDASGYVTLQVPGVKNRVQNVVGDLSQVFVSYDASDSAYGQTTYSTSAGSITTAMKTNYSVDVSANCILNGYRADASGYDYYKCSSYSFLDVSSKSILYHDSSDVTYSTSGTAPNRDIVYLNIIGTQVISDNSNTLVDLWQDENGNPSINGAETDASDTQFSPLVRIDGFDLASIEFDKFRVRYVPKTLDDLNITLTNGWTLTTGSVSSATGLESDALFTQVDASYVTAAFNNFNLKGFDRLNSNSNHGLGLANLYSGPSFALDISYASAHTRYGSDIVTFSINTGSMDLQGNGVPLTSGSFVGYGTDTNWMADPSSNPLGSKGGAAYFKSAIQIPLGNYTNVYMLSPWLHTDGNSKGRDENIRAAVDVSANFEGANESDRITSKLSFDRTSVMPLFATVQGSSEAEASYLDASMNYWTDLCQPVSVAAYAGSLTSSDLSGAALDAVSKQSPYEYTDFSGTNGNVSISLGLDRPDSTSYQLSSPQYVAPLAVVSSEYAISGFAKNVTDGNLFDSSFNPSKLPSPPTFHYYDGSYDTGIFYDLTPDEGVGASNITLSIRYADVSFNIDMSNLIIGNFGIWYCKSDLYNINYSIPSASLSRDFYKLNDNSNNVLNISDLSFSGVSVLGTNVKPGSKIGFSLKGDSIDYQMVKTVDPSPVHELKTSDDLLLTGDGTKSIGLALYRGYPMYAVSEVNETQNYVVERTHSTATFLINDASYGDSWVLATDTSGSTLFGLRVNSANSINGSGSSTYPISLTGDAVTVSYIKNGNTTHSANRTLNAAGALFSIPNTNYSIVSGRITAGGNGYPATETYIVSKSHQTVTIKYSEKWSGLYDVPPSDWEYTHDQSFNITNAAMVSGIQLTPNIKIYGPSGLRYSSNTPSTYLNLPPPFLKFQAFTDNASAVIPFQISNVTSNNKIVAFTPVLSDEDSEFYPFEDIDASINNMMFVRNDEHMLYNYLTAPNIVVNNLKVQGSEVVITENCNGHSYVIYSGPIQSMASVTLYDVNINYQEATVKFGYGQNDGTGADSSYKIYFVVQDFFMVGEASIHVNAGQNVKISLYGTEPITIDGKYAVRVHKYVDTASRGYEYDASFTDLDAAGNRDPSGNTSMIIKDNQIQLSASYHFTYDVEFPTVTIGEEPYTLSNVINQIEKEDFINANWLLDENYTPAPMNFDMVALSLPGVNKIKSLFSLSENLKTGDIGGTYAKLVYITLPDLFCAVSADGSPVMRITYNGTVVTPMVSTSTISLISQASTFTPNRHGINDEVIDYNVTTFETRV